MAQFTNFKAPNTASATLPSRGATFFMLFITVLCLMVSLVFSFMSLRALTKWEPGQGTVVSHNVTSLPPKKGKARSSYKPVYEVTDGSGNKIKVTSQYGYDTTDGINIGDVVSIRHNGRDTAMLSSFGSLYAAPLFSWFVFFVFGHRFWKWNKELAAAGNPVFKL